MKKVWIADNPGNAHLLKGLLESRGVEAFVQGEQTFAVRGGGAPWGDMNSYPSVWVRDDSQHDEARAIAKEFEKTNPAPEGKPWTCPKCGEKLDAQFTDCWKCSGDPSE